MKKGGDLDIDQRTYRAIRIVALVMPLLLLVYGLVIMTGNMPEQTLAYPIVFGIIMALWIPLGIYQFILATTKRKQLIGQLIAYHILAVAYILFVCGLASPLTMGWIILFMVSLIYVGETGVILSALLLFITTILEIMPFSTTIQSIPLSLFYVLTVLLTGLMAVVINISQSSDRASLARSRSAERLQRDRLSTIVNNLADAVLSTNSNGVIQIYNAASLDLLDTNSSLEGRNIDDVIRLYDNDKRKFSLARNFKKARGVQIRDDLEAVISEEPTKLSLIYSPIRSTNSHARTGSDGYIVIMRDITKQKTLDEERDEFISVVSHELRTPIAVAEGTLSNLDFMMKRGDAPAHLLAENISVAHDQIIFLGGIINDLSTLSRAERGIADTPERIDVSALIHEIYNEYQAQAEAKHLQLNLDLVPRLGTINTSRLYVKELLQNFVTNAIKYTKEGDVTIIAKVDEDKVHFSVKDSGIGISKSDQKRIFDKFFRSEDFRTRETGGTGLGLYVAAKLAKKLGTEIELSSRLNHGSTFSFSLPLEPSSIDS